tara:strand:+ start:40 stop:813 length:774 start_codon:yes stop_codon:yes gene_type:complete
MKNSVSIKNIIQKGTWYHSVDFEGNKSKGTFDYNNIMSDLNLPNMSGLKIMDVGCSDGYFSKYFLESLGAEYVRGIDFNKYDGSIAFEVLNTYENDYKEKYENHADYDELQDDYSSLNLSDSNKFNFVKKIFDLNMEYSFGSIYDLSNFENFDVTFCGSLLEHLRDPITAIEQLYFKTNNFCIIDISNTFKSGLFSKSKPYLKYTGSGGNFYHYTPSAVKLMMKNIGFKDIKSLSSYKIKIEKYDYKIPHEILIGYK